MKKYSVMIPIAAACFLEVKAENENEAIEKALYSEELSLDKVEEWEAVKEFCSGNVINVHNSEAYAEEIDEEEDGEI